MGDKSLLEMTGTWFVFGHAKEVTGPCPKLTQERTCGWICHPGMELLVLYLRRLNKGSQELTEHSGAILERESLSEEIFEQRPKWRTGREPWGKSILSKGTSKCKGSGGRYEGAMFKARSKVNVARTESASRRQEGNAVRASIVLSPFIFLLSLKVLLFCGLLLLFMLVVTWVLPLTL